MDATTTLAPSQPAGTTADARETTLDNPIVLTAKAVEMIKDAIAREGLVGHGIRVGVVGGGCSGFQYSMDFEKDGSADDLTIEQDGLKLFVDPMSAMYLRPQDGQERGKVTIDYVVGLQGAGFKFSNPHARSTCGCGSSFQA